MVGSISALFDQCRRHWRKATDQSTWYERISELGRGPHPVKSEVERISFPDREVRLSFCRQAASWTRAELFIRQLDELKIIKRAAQKAMVAESWRHPAYRVLIQVADLGPVRIAQLIATVDTPWRFSSKQPFWKYLGLAVETRTTADHEIENGRVYKRKKQFVRTRGLNQDYNRG